MGRLLTRNALIEVFRNPATPVEIRTCQGKLSNLECDLLRQAKRRRKTWTEETLPFLWLIMPTASDDVRQGFGVSETETSGVYAFPILQRVGLVVVHQLPKTEDTLWLRILGRAGDQRRAVEEFAQRPTESSLHTSIEELLADYRAILEKQRKLTPEEEELVMNLSAAYLKKQEEWKQEGLEQGLEQGVTTVASNLLREGIATELIAKVTKLTLEEIEQLRESSQII